MPPTVDPSSNPFLTAREAALYLGASYGQLAQWRYAQKGPPYAKVGGSARYKLSDLRAWLEARTREATTPPPAANLVTSLVGARPAPARRVHGFERIEGAQPVLDALWEACRDAGSVREWCQVNDFDWVVIGAVLRGERAIPPRVAMKLGFKVIRIMRYERKS